MSVQAKANFHVWNFWYVFECISWLNLEWKLNWNKVSFKSLSLAWNIFTSFESQQNVGLLRRMCLLLRQHSSLVVYFMPWIIFQKNTKCFMNSLNNGMHRKDIWFFQKNHFTSSNPIKTGKHKINFHCTWPFICKWCLRVSPQGMCKQYKCKHAQN